MYFMAVWNNFWLFGIVSGHLVYFSGYGMKNQNQAALRLITQTGGQMMLHIFL
jgi:hypothetical protein